MTKLMRIIYHWTGGAHVVSRLDREHYHYIIDGSGVVHAGDHAPEANENTSDGAYAAHTLSCNSGSIGISVAAMACAVERPFDAGKYPVTGAQVTALGALIKALSQKYGIAITPATVLGHAEVEPTLGIKQRGKWDISWLPGMDEPENPVAVGDRIRSLAIGAVALALPGGFSRVTIREGSRGAAVQEWQRVLGVTADGVFGPETKARTVDWQRKHGLADDGIVGPATWATTK